MKFGCLILAVIAANATALPPERPKQPNFTRLYVEPSGALVAEVTTREFYRSQDSGAHWTAIAKQPSFEQLRNIGLNPAQQICMPRDFGAFWTCAGLSENVSVIDGEGTLYQCAGARLASSSVDGEHWQALTTSDASSTKIDHCAHTALLVKKILASGGKTDSTLPRAGKPTTDAGRGLQAFVTDDDLAVIGLMQGSGTLYATTRQRSTSDFSIRTSADGGRELEAADLRVTGTLAYFRRGPCFVGRGLFLRGRTECSWPTGGFVP